jgi:hypothetical protein
MLHFLGGTPKAPALATARSFFLAVLTAEGRAVLGALLEGR